MINNPTDEDFIQGLFHMDHKYKHEKVTLVKIFSTLVLQENYFKSLSLYGLIPHHYKCCCSKCQVQAHTKLFLILPDDIIKTSENSKSFALFDQIILVWMQTPLIVDGWLIVVGAVVVGVTTVVLFLLKLGLIVTVTDL